MRGIWKSVWTKFLVLSRDSLRQEQTSKNCTTMKGTDIQNASLCGTFQIQTITFPKTQGHIKMWHISSPFPRIIKVSIISTIFQKPKFKELSEMQINLLTVNPSKIKKSLSEIHEDYVYAIGMCICLSIVDGEDLGTWCSWLNSNVIKEDVLVCFTHALKYSRMVKY